jgi:hypothetical protein
LHSRHAEFNNRLKLTVGRQANPERPPAAYRVFAKPTKIDA